MNRWSDFDTSTPDDRARWAFEREEREWQPVKTAPEDVAVLAFWTPLDGDRITGCHYGVTIYERGAWRDIDDRETEYSPPTNWKRLSPPSPKETGNE